MIIRFAVLELLHADRLARSFSFVTNVQNIDYGTLAASSETERRGKLNQNILYIRKRKVTIHEQRDIVRRN
jgi:hypothetical protein